MRSQSLFRFLAVIKRKEGKAGQMTQSGEFILVEIWSRNVTSAYHRIQALFVCFTLFLYKVQTCYNITI